MRFYDTVVGHRYILYFMHRCFYYYYYMIVVIKKFKNKSRFEKKKLPDYYSDWIKLVKYNYRYDVDCSTRVA